MFVSRYPKTKCFVTVCLKCLVVLYLFVTLTEMVLPSSVHSGWSSAPFIPMERSLLVHKIFFELCLTDVISVMCEILPCPESSTLWMFVDL